MGRKKILDRISFVEIGNVENSYLLANYNNMKFHKDYSTARSEFKKTFPEVSYVNNNQNTIGCASFNNNYNSNNKNNSNNNFNSINNINNADAPYKI